MPEPKRCSCCEKHTLRAQEEKKKLLNRLRRIEGQVRGLQAMVEADAYCNADHQCAGQRRHQRL